MTYRCKQLIVQSIIQIHGYRMLRSQQNVSH